MRSLVNQLSKSNNSALEPETTEDPTCPVVISTAVDVFFPCREAAKLQNFEFALGVLLPMN